MTTDQLIAALPAQTPFKVPNCGVTLSLAKGHCHVVAGVLFVEYVTTIRGKPARARVEFTLPLAPGTTPGDVVAMLKRGVTRDAQEVLSRRASSRTRRA